MYPSDFPTAAQHNYSDMDEKGYWVCQTCGHSVKIVREGTCIGVPIYYKWDDVPDTMATKTTLYKEHGLKVSSDQQPVGAKKQYDRKGKATGGYHPLYLIADGTPKKKATPAQLEALEKARHMAEKLTVVCSKCKDPIEGKYDWHKVTRKQWIEKGYDNYVCFRCKDRSESVEWANEILADDDVLILDTETTDFDGEIIEIAIIDVRGKVLLNQRIKPRGEISQGAYHVHGISLEDLKDCPSFPDVYHQIKSILQGKQIVIYNAQFDVGILNSDCSRHDLKRLKIDSHCAMEWYAQYCGDWSDYHGNYRWYPLTGGDHSALGDCKATLLVIQEMARYEAKVLDHG